jgi:hypothetical protein
MSPLSIPCANAPLCPGIVSVLGDLCSKCRSFACPTCGGYLPAGIVVSGETVVDIVDAWMQDNSLRLCGEEIRIVWVESNRVALRSKPTTESAQSNPK